MPTTLNFGKLLGKSPFKPMIRHMKIATECAGHIPEAVTAFFDNDKNRLKEIKQAVSQLESDADKIFEQLQHRLSKSLFLPVERRDLLDVIEMQEAIADRTEDIVGLMVDLPMDVPEELHSPIHMLTDRAVDAVKVAGDIIGKFDELLETGFKGPEVRKTRELIRQVIELETDAEWLQDPGADVLVEDQRGDGFSDGERLLLIRDAASSDLLVEVNAVGAGPGS